MAWILGGGEKSRPIKFSDKVAVSYILEIHHLIPNCHSFYSDIDECSETPGICGLGTCANNDDGTFYECNCQNGAMTTGQNSLGTLTCVG